MKTICLILPSIACGGMERIMLILAEYFVVKKNAKVHLILLTRKNKFYDVPGQVSLHEPEFDYRQYWRVASVFKTMLYLQGVIKNAAPDTILSFGDKYNMFSIASCLLIGRRIFVSDRNALPIRSLALKLVKAMLYCFTKGIIVQTEDAKNNLKIILSRTNIAVIGNPVVLPGITDYTREKIILSVGRMISSKGQDKLLDIFSKTDFKDWMLVFVGDGPLRGELEKKSCELGIEKNVSFQGNRKDVEYYYSRSSIFAFTSKSEGFPNVLVEAMCHSLPCLSFDCIAGISEIIQSGYSGFLVPLDDMQEYSDKLMLLMKDGQLRERMGEKAREHVARYSIDIIGKRFYDFISS